MELKKYNAVMSKMKFKIITPGRVVFEDEVDGVIMMTKTGEITVLSHHIPLVTVLVSGEMRCQKDGRDLIMAVSGGFAEMRADNTLVVLADTAERAVEIDVERAEVARQRAAKLMAEERNKESVDYVAIQAALEKALNRVKIGKKYKKLPDNKMGGV